MIAEDSSIKAGYQYSAFGSVTATFGEEAESNPWRFSTKPVEADTGWSYYGFRYYDTSSGRWASRDPIEEEGGANLYGFVGNDGAGKVDLFGLSAFGGDQCPCGSLIDDHCCAGEKYDPDKSCCYKNQEIRTPKKEFGGWNALCYFNVCEARDCSRELDNCQQRAALAALALSYRMMGRKVTSGKGSIKIVTTMPETYHFNGGCTPGTTSGNGHLTTGVVGGVSSLYYAACHSAHVACTE